MSAGDHGHDDIKVDLDEERVERMALFVDIADHRRIEKALKESSARIRNKTGCHER